MPVYNEERTLLDIIKEVKSINVEKELIIVDDGSKNKTKIIKELNLKANRFEIEAELTSKVLKRGYKIYEVPISYRSRSYHEGKKIAWRDGIKTFLAIFKYRLVR